MSVGASISVMALLSTFDASCGCFSRCLFLSGWSPLNTRIPCVWSCLRTMHAMHALVTSNRSLEHIGSSDHLALRSCIALPHWLGPLLKLWLSGTENRPGRRRSNAAPRSVALLVLVLMFALSFHHSSVVF
jgi:hypothetical protein